ncbi:GLPGLI family protein [Chryseobacterium sp. OV279]|nr:GLPGLI family protein [Chryseobacterium sp. OV279]
MLNVVSKNRNICGSYFNAENMKFYFSLFLFIVSFARAQVSVTGNFSMKPDSYEVKVIDKSLQNIYYKLKFVRDTKNSGKKLEAVCILQLGEHSSKFSDFNSLRKDSLMEKFSHLDHLGSKELNQTLNLSEKWKNVVVKSFSEGKIIVQDVAKNTYQYEERQPVLNWALETETKNILGYSCNKAIAKYRGRKYTAWYSKDIPIHNGPYVFQGLPGLILEIEDSKSNFHFMAVGIDKKAADIYLRSEKRILVITREQFRKIAQNYHDNPGFFLGKSYDINGNAIIDGGKKRPYNPIEME